MLFLSRFKRSRGGATAVEFAMVALPFFFLLFAIFDISLMFFASTTLENGIVAAARKIRTGEVQAANITADQFRNIICDDISMLLACDGRLAIDVRKYQSFSKAKYEPALDKNGNLIGAMKFEPGSAGDVVVVRAFYVWPVFTPTLGVKFANMADGHRLLEASFAFRNEPFNGPMQN
jgi:Flp pilus assembly protein TadG